MDGNKFDSYRHQIGSKGCQGQSVEKMDRYHNNIAINSINYCSLIFVLSSEGSFSCLPPRGLMEIKTWDVKNQTLMMKLCRRLFEVALLQLYLSLSSNRKQSSFSARYENNFVLFEELCKNFCIFLGRPVVLSKFMAVKLLVFFLQILSNYFEGRHQTQHELLQY